MSYIKAVDILPEELLDKIQEYIDGGYIYIPRKENSRKAWGANTKSREYIASRNIEIYGRYKAGIPVASLSEIYYLSPKRIQRILSKMRPEI